MRLDKFLQVTGLIKRRAVAHEACRRGLVAVNGRAAKPTRTVAAGDVIRLDLPRRLLEVRLEVTLAPGATLPRARRAEALTVLRDEARRGELDPALADDDDPRGAPPPGGPPRGPVPAP